MTGNPKSRITSRLERLRRALIVSASGGACLLAMYPTTLHAQDTASTADAQETASDENSAESSEQADDRNVIIVTARFSAESDLKVGQSITAVGEKEIEKTGIADLADFVGRVPSVSYGGGSPNQNTPIIRGVSSPGLGGGGDFIPTAQVVGNYFDDVPINSPSQSNRDVPLYDVQRVEILRGPQGTLYGESSVGGTIRYVTNDPDLSSIGIRGGGTISDYWGGNDLSVDGDVTLNLPIVTDRFGIRGTGFYRRDAGFIDYTRVTPNREDGNTFERYGGRVVALWNPTDRFSLRAVVQLEEGFVSGNFQVTTALPIEQLENATILIPTTQQEKNQLYSLKATYDLDFGSITSITSRYNRNYINTSFFEFIFNFFGGEPFWELDNSVELTSQELRFVSNFDGRFNFVAGLFYKEGLFVSDSVTSSPDYLDRFGFETAFDSFLDQKDKQYAAFGELYFQAADRLRLIAGGRYYINKSFHRGVNQPSVLIPNGESHEFGFELESFLPKAAVEFQATDDVLFYANAAKGARIGGINNVVAVAELPPEEREGSRTYDPDSLWSYDLGVKALLFDDKLRLDASAFYTDWKDLQFTLYSPQTQTTYNRNVGQAHTQGIEGSARLQITDTTLLQLSGALIEAETDVDVTTGQRANPVIEKGTRLTFVPKYTWSAAVEQVIPIGDVNIRARADYRESGPQASNLGVNPISSYGIVDLRLSAEYEGWSATLFAKNVTNELVRRGTLGAQSFLLTRPRSIGLTLRYQM